MLDVDLIFYYGVFEYHQPKEIIYYLFAHVIFLLARCFSLSKARELIYIVRLLFLGFTMDEEDLKEIKKFLREHGQEFGPRDREILSKFLKGEGLSPKELIRAVQWSIPLFSLAVLNRRFQLNRSRADEEWLRFIPEKLGDIGSVEHLKILPLIDSLGVGELCTEEGVSYYIEADDVRFLFDTGLNSKQEHPSPLLRNMQALGVSVEDIDYVFISHLHGDHVGGGRWASEGKFALSGEQLNLSRVEAFTPVPMSHPSARVTHLKSPRVIVDGVASIGPITRPMFFMGSVVEHSLAFNVEGKGLVVIVGCGHQGLQKIIDRVGSLFDTPLYGIIGGIHYPISGFRKPSRLGLPTHKIGATGKPPWDPLNRGDLEKALEHLKARSPKLVAISPHDSCDESIGSFEEIFREAYTHIGVGKSITVS